MEGVLAYLTEDLTFRAVVLVEIEFGSVAPRAFTIVRDIAFTTTTYGFYWFVVTFVTPFEILHKVTVIPWLYIEYQG